MSPASTARTESTRSTPPLSRSGVSAATADIRSAESLRRRRRAWESATPPTRPQRGPLRCCFGRRFGGFGIRRSNWRRRRSRCSRSRRTGWRRRRPRPGRNQWGHGRCQQLHANAAGRQQHWRRRWCVAAPVLPELTAATGATAVAAESFGSGLTAQGGVGGNGGNGGQGANGGNGGAGGAAVVVPSLTTPSDATGGTGAAGGNGGDGGAGAAGTNGQNGGAGGSGGRGGLFGGSGGAGGAGAKGGNGGNGARASVTRAVTAATAVTEADSAAAPRRHRGWPTPPTARVARVVQPARAAPPERVEPEAPWGAGGGSGLGGQPGVTGASGGNGTAGQAGGNGNPGTLPAPQALTVRPTSSFGRRTVRPRPVMGRGRFTAVWCGARRWRRCTACAPCPVYSRGRGIPRVPPSSSNRTARLSVTLLATISAGVGSIRVCGDVCCLESGIVEDPWVARPQLVCLVWPVSNLASDEPENQ